jgi:hypothetical protein
MWLKCDPGRDLVVALLLDARDVEVTAPDALGGAEEAPDGLGQTLGEPQAEPHRARIRITAKPR